MIQRKQGLAWGDDAFDTQDTMLLPTLDTPKTKKSTYRPWYICWNVHIPFLLGAWVLIFSIGELVAPRYAVHSCSWANVDEHEHRLIVIADPQLTDYYSYAMARGSWTLALTEFYSDLYMRRNFQQITRMHTPPDSVLVLGDIFDGGRILDADAYAQHRDRFNWIFNTGRQKIQFYNMTGNHDVGIKEWYSAEAAKNFEQLFGPTQYTVVLGHVELVVIDTIAMLSSNSTVRDAAVNFVKSYGSMRAKQNYPRILFTHIPLYRPDHGATCGPLRSSPIKQGQGVSYQNVIPKQMTDFILAMIEPTHIFSGDDHAHCTYYHPQGVYEDTLATFSWLQGERNPEFVMLSLQASPVHSQAFHMSICSLPDQMAIYFWYAFFGGLSVIYLIFGNIRPFQTKYWFTSKIKAYGFVIAAASSIYALILFVSVQ